MKKKIISKIELNFITFIIIISGIQIIFLPLIKHKFKIMVFHDIPLNEINYYCKKEKVINASKTSFISLFCKKITQN